MNKAQMEGHEVKEFTKEDLDRAMHVCRQAGIKCENSAAAAFSVLPQLDVARDDRVVVVNTGRGLVEAKFE